MKTKYISLWRILLINLAGCTCVCPLLFGGEGPSQHLTKVHQVPSISARYHLVDLGEIDASAEELSRFSGATNASPAINNGGEIIANSKEGGVFIRPNLRAYNPRIGGARLEFRGLNNNGDILVAIHRGKDQTDWVIWPKNLQGQERSIPIDPVELRGSDLVLNGMNDARWIVGETRPDGHYRPLLWTPDQGLFRVGFFNGLDLRGVIRQLNERGSILGQFMGSIEHPPFFWDPELGLVVLDKYRSHFKPEPEGRIEFSDLVMADDGTVYGTYWINDQLKDLNPTALTPHETFIWIPSQKEFYYVNKEGMRIAQVNPSHELVGTLRGKAAICDPGCMPLLLSQLTLVEDLEGWDLLEASGINDLGQIVGFGTRKGQTHLFRADPLP